MSLSRQSLVERAWLRNQSAGGAAALVPISRYDSFVTQALTELARKIASDPDRADLLRKDFSLTVTSGTASLTTHLTASEPMLLGFLKFAKITSSDSAYPWQYFPDFASLNLSRPTFGLIGFAIEGSSLQVADTSGVTGTLNTTATANSSFVPLAATLSGYLDLEEEATELLARFAATGDVMDETKAEVANAG